MPTIYGARLTTFEDSEKESEYGYVRKVNSLIVSFLTFLISIWFVFNVELGLTGNVSSIFYLMICIFRVQLIVITLILDVFMCFMISWSVFFFLK